MTVRELLTRCDSRELTEWLAYYQIEPWGEERADLRAAINTTVLANVNRGKSQRAYKIEDFMPDFDAAAGQAERPQQDWRDMRARFYRAAGLPMPPMRD